MAAEVAGDENTSTQCLPLSFLDLPAEVQQEIISHCSQSDLICVALVSKRFHELASAQLYRNFHIIFPDDDDLTFESPIDGLAGGLDTFTTSDYNYAKHLKDLSMDTLSAGLKAEHAYKSYLYSASCGKFLNTLLYLTLKKASSLEAFRWNIRVELSRPVYQQLHKISSLTKLHIRMQAGESYYLPPPPLPVSLDSPEGPLPVANHWTEVPPLSPGPMPVLSLPLTGNAPNYSIPSGPPPSLLHPPRPPSKTKPNKRGSSSMEPPTLSGFKNLKSLSVLDIDNLDVVTELKTCVRNSSSTLDELSLSLSDHLAMQARKPPPDSDPDDSDVEDDFQLDPSQNVFDPNGPAKTLRAQEERKLQEAILGRIFDVELFLVKKPQIQAEVSKPGPSNEQIKQNERAVAQDPREAYVSSIKGVSHKLMSMLNGSREFSGSQQDMLDTIERAARKYVESGDVPATANGLAGSSSSANSSGVRGEQGDPQAKPADSVPVNPEVNIADGQASPSSRTPPDRSWVKDTQEITPEDIDIEHLDSIEDEFEESDNQAGKGPVITNGQLQSREGGSSSSDSTTSPRMTPASSTISSHFGRAFTNLTVQSENFVTLVAKLEEFEKQAQVLNARIRDMRNHATEASPDDIKEAEKDISALSQRTVDIQHQIRIAEAELHDAENQIKRESRATPIESKQRCIDEYIRDTRGFSLEKLSVYLIPVKASVLSRAIDLRSLKQLTLLNVGNQTPIWTLLCKENKVNPLALRSVFTDNVSTAFLNCMAQLDELHELFMLERSAKHKPESFAARSTTTIDQIRRLVLKRHMPTLRRLMIKDESNGPMWDANQKTMIMICNRGRLLEELAVSMNIHAVHAFMQYFSGLVNLRAINILHFKNSDTCIWVMREILRFIVDNLSHHPELKLEWIAMEDERVDRVIRPSHPDMEDGNDSEDKGKSKAPFMPEPNSPFPVLPVEGLDSESESDEDDAFDSGKRLRLKTVGPLQFYDVWGVKIFEKEIRHGRL